MKLAILVFLLGVSFPGAVRAAVDCEVPAKIQVDHLNKQIWCVKQSIPVRAVDVEFFRKRVATAPSRFLEKFA